jgi:NAD(P)-dependent dehydrogenase (short-subunit alcohol dehydrogenase family)
MSDIRFDDRVVVVTGAGGDAPSLGRSHALLFAELGAKVVVNDLGVGSDGRGTLHADAETVAAQIRAAGGEAVADTHSVADDVSARAVVQTAIDTWGRIDVLVNNATVAHLAEFDQFSPADVRVQVDVNLMGSIWMCQAAWPHMRAAGYGRIVNIASNGVFGGHDVAIYGTAKGGIFSLTNNLAADGAAHGIVVNTLAPGALTNAMTLHLEEESVQILRDTMAGVASPDLVSPVVAYLGHEACPITGRFFMSAAGRVQEYVFQVTPGYASPELTVDEVAANFERIVDRTGMIDVPPPQASPYKPRPYTPG